MLARTFKTAAELGIPEHEARALQTVLYMLEDGEIKPQFVFMREWTQETACGTTHCLAGWAHDIDPNAFPIDNDLCGIAQQLRDRLPTELSALFGIDNMIMALSPPAQATESLRHYLETGICNRK